MRWYYRIFGTLYLVETSYSKKENMISGGCYPPFRDVDTYRAMCVAAAEKHAHEIRRKQFNVALGENSNLESMLEQMERAIVTRQITNHQIGALDVAKMKEKEFCAWYWHTAKD